jgi:hypothetical protein
MIIVFIIILHIDHYKRKKAPGWSVNFGFRYWCIDYIFRYVCVVIFLLYNLFK